MTAFLYPKEKHRRRLSPGPFASYRRYKPSLRREFDRACVYCRKPDGLSSKGEFGVDHYRPKDRFPALETAYSNLYYACNTCNSYKQDFWPTPAELKQGWFIPNPCDHSMWEHLRFRGTKVVTRSDAGKAAEQILFLNEDSIVQWREFVLQTADLWREKLKALRQTKQDIDVRLAKTTEGPVHAKLLRGQRANAREMRVAIRQLVRLGVRRA